MRLKSDGPYCEWPERPSHNIRPERKVDWMHMIMSALAVMSFVAMVLVSLILVGSI